MYCVLQLAHEDMVGRRYVDSEMAALELEQAETDRLASQLETQLRVVMKSGTPRSYITRDVRTAEWVFKFGLVAVQFLK